MTEFDKNEIDKCRNQRVVKHNDLVQKSKYKLSIHEQKTIAFLVSLIKPNDKSNLEYEFEIIDFCRICGIDEDGGKNYEKVRKTLFNLASKGLEVKLDNNAYTRVSWLNKYWCYANDGTVKVRFDEDLAPYLFSLQENTTRYELLNILPMQSKYSIRLYELCRSWAGIKNKTYPIDELRDILGVPVDVFGRYNDFKRKVLITAQTEINKFTDLDITFDEIKKGKKVVKIQIHIDLKSPLDNMMTRIDSNSVLNKKDRTLI